MRSVFSTSWFLQVNNLVVILFIHTFSLNSLFKQLLFSFILSWLDPILRTWNRNRVWKCLLRICIVKATIPILEFIDFYMGFWSLSTHTILIKHEHWICFKRKCRWNLCEHDWTLISIFFWFQHDVISFQLYLLIL